MSFDSPYTSSSSSSSSNGDSATPTSIAEDDCALSPPSPRIVDLVEYTRTGSLIIPQSLNEHWTAHSIPILLNVYYTLDFLHDTYKKSGPQGPLLWATHLFARTYITNLRYPTAIDNGSVQQTDKELGTYLGKTLSAVSEALQTPDGPMRDDVLATVWILTNYEVRKMFGSTSVCALVLMSIQLLMGTINRVTPQSPWHLHTNGLYSILKQRGAASLRKIGNRMGFWPAYNMVVSRSKAWYQILD